MSEHKQQFSSYGNVDKLMQGLQSCSFGSEPNCDECPFGTGCTNQIKKGSFEFISLCIDNWQQLMLEILMRRQEKDPDLESIYRMMVDMEKKINDGIGVYL